MDENYDLVIIGSGPAGLAASVYASRYKLSHVVFGSAPGGQMQSIHAIENWPGEISISGFDLISKFVDQVKHYGIEIRNEVVISVEPDGDVFQISTSKGVCRSRAVIFATGSEYRKLEVPGEKELTGKGVSYCATCDAMFFRGKTVAVAGGGNSSAVMALTLAEYAARVYLVHRGESIACEEVWKDRLRENPKVEMVSDASVIEIKGENKVERIILDNPYNDHTFLNVDGVFVAVGTAPGVALAKEAGVETDKDGFIVTNPDQGTSMRGIFAAGDITTGSDKFRQVITAAAEGAIAANGAYKFLKER